MKNFRVSFLPAFFVCLAIVFTTAVAFRIHSYQSAGDSGPSSAPRPLTSPGPDVPVVERPSTSPPQTSETLTLLEEKPPAAAQPSGHEAVLPPVSARVPRDEISRVVEAVWFSARGIRTGESDALHVRAAPNASITAVSGQLQSESRTARLPFQCSVGADSVWNCRLSVPTCVACGRWSIGELQITSASNVVTVPASHPLITGSSIRVSGDSCDSALPFLHAVAIGGNGEESGEVDSVIFTLTVADGYCGVGSVEGIAESSHGQRATFTAALSGDENTWAGRLRVSSSTERGKWRVSSIEVTDRAGNFRIYSTEDPLIKDAVFEVR